MLDQNDVDIMLSRFEEAGFKNVAITPENALEAIPALFANFAEKAEGQIEAAKAFALSRNDETPEPDPVMVSLFTRSLKTQREQAIKSGGITEACAKAIDALFLPNGKPTGFALSRGPDDNPDPIISRLYDVLASNGGGLRHNSQIERPFAASRDVPTSTGMDADKADDFVDVEAARTEGKAWQNRELSSRGLAAE